MAKTPKTAALADTHAPPISPILTHPSSVEAYQDLYNALGRAYWEASDIQSKDTVQGARDAIYDIITQLHQAQLEGNTARFIAIVPAIQSANAALKSIQTSIDQITKNISTVATVIAAINRILSFAGSL